MTYKTSIYIFHRSLRLDDNLGLIEALKQSDVVIPIFIFTPEQVGKNKYKSENAIVFMINALLDLNSYLKRNVLNYLYFTINNIKLYHHY
jgi:deoxyribodipyrimidine photo-lyase